MTSQHDLTEHPVPRLRVPPEERRVAWVQSALRHRGVLPSGEVDVLAAPLTVPARGGATGRAQRDAHAGGPEAEEGRLLVALSAGHAGAQQPRTVVRRTLKPRPCLDSGIISGVAWPLRPESSPVCMPDATLEISPQQIVQ